LDVLMPFYILHNIVMFK